MAQAAIKSQREAAKILGVDKETIRGDLGLKGRGENSPPFKELSFESEGDQSDSGENSPPDEVLALWRKAIKEQGKRNDFSNNITEVKATWNISLLHSGPSQPRGAGTLIRK